MKLKNNGKNQNAHPCQTSKGIELYIIAGQSNAAGYTQIDSDILTSLWSNHKTGTPNVLYRGCAEFTNHVNTELVSTGAHSFADWTPAKSGQGISTSHMGPEVGIAATFAPYYHTKKQVAGIIKYAHGGTSLFNDFFGENAANGNWVSPTYAKRHNLEFSGLTGNLYRNLIKTVHESIEALKNQRYDSISIKGVFWMQGESNRENPSDYELAIRDFICDIRGSLGKLTNQRAIEIPFIIGEISETSGSADSKSVAINLDFIKMQRKMASLENNIYVISSGQFRINELDENGINYNSQDAWHWTTKPMFQIGQLVAECILKNNR